MKKQLIYGFIVMFLVFSFVSASLGTFKQNDCVKIVVPSSSTYVNLTNVITPSPNSTIYSINSIMEQTGSMFNYTFCNTSTYGVYTYGYCDSTGCYGNDFSINGSGQVVSQEQINLLIIGLVVMFIVIAFFFILSLLFKHPGTKIFLMAMSGITLILMIGLITANAETYLAEFPNIVNFYHSYYIFAIGMASACMLGIVIWLIYYAFTLFNKTRGTYNED